MSTDMKRRAILMFLHDRPGALNKISMLIRKKMYNVDTLTTCCAKAPGVSRMTLTLRENDDAKVRQVIRQLEKFIEVISAKELDHEQSYWREVAILKIETDGAIFENCRRSTTSKFLIERKPTPSSCRLSVRPGISMISWKRSMRIILSKLPAPA